MLAPIGIVVIGRTIAGACVSDRHWKRVTAGAGGEVQAQ